MGVSNETGIKSSTGEEGSPIAAEAEMECIAPVFRRAGPFLALHTSPVEYQEVRRA